MQQDNSWYVHLLASAQRSVGWFVGLALVAVLSQITTQESLLGIWSPDEILLLRAEVCHWIAYCLWRYLLSWKCIVTASGQTGTWL